MGVTIGPADWWAISPEGIRSFAIACSVGTTLPDGSRIICKSCGGSAWIVAPCSTQVSATWNGTTSACVGPKPCVSDWATLNTALLNNGFDPRDWFVPSVAQLVNPGYCCRTQWDPSSNPYWSTADCSATTAYFVNFGNGTTGICNKAFSFCVRAFRCVTY
jgi:hypothetical protein